MADALITHYGPDVPRHIATMIGAVHPKFDAQAFLRDVLDGYDALALMPRGHKIAETLRVHLPPDYPRAIKILLASIDQPATLPGKNPMASFLFLPHTMFVAKFGLDHFELSMRAQHALTQRFTAEFSVREFIDKNQILALKTLEAWARDPNEHVRRLVSEGTRPRLPWARRLRAFMRDPRPVLQLLELLKDDPSLYVRRSVANNLNDIGKDHPDLLFATAARWMKDANEARQWIIRHALRSAVKRGEAGALRVLGYGDKAKVAIRNARVSPARVKKRGTVQVQFEVASTSPKTQRLVVDLRVHYRKANGKTSPKVFKLRALTLPAKGTESFSKRLSLKDLTTRKHYPGAHNVEVVINGAVTALGEFELMSS